MIVDISGKVIVVTGSSRGIGRELVRELAKERAKIVINYYSSEAKAKELHSEILSYNSNCVVVKADVTNPADVDHLYKKSIEAFGNVDILINNAGICDDNLMQMMTLEQWKRIIDVNLTGTFLCCKEFSKSMIEQRSGKIINIASLKGQEGDAGQINYSVSKAGIIGLTKSLAKELGQYNIAVNAICPGFILTDLNRQVLKKKDIAEKKSVLNVDKSMNDLINFVLLLASDLSQGISGREFNLDSRIL